MLEPESTTMAIGRPERLGKSKIFNDLNGNQTHDFPACGVVPQARTLPGGKIKYGKLLHISPCQTMSSSIRNVNFTNFFLDLRGFA
jgi:hypothetical protein